jgi:hypothetical protein
MFKKEFQRLKQSEASQATEAITAAFSFTEFCPQMTLLIGFMKLTARMITVIINTRKQKMNLLTMKICLLMALHFMRIVTVMYRVMTIHHHVALTMNLCSEL